MMGRPGDRRHRGRITAGFCLLAGFVLTWAACSRGDERPHASDRLPRQIHPAAARTLIAAEDAYRIGRYDTALALVDSARAVDPDLADPYFLRGLIYGDLRRFDASQESYREVLARDSTYQGARLNIGNNLARVGNHRAALQHYLAEAARYPSADVYVRVGYAYENVNRVDSARAAYERAIRLDSTYADAYARLAQLLSTRGAYAEALDHIRDAIRIAPDNLDYRYFLGYLLLQTGDVESASTHLRRVAEARPGHYGAHYNLGRALAHAGNAHLAQRHFARADTLQAVEKEIGKLQSRAEVYNERPGAWLDLAEALRRNGRIEEALDAYKVAAYLDPGNDELQANVATLALMSGRAEEAVARLERLVRKDSSLVQAWFNLGIAYTATKQRAKAHRAWQMVLKLEPGHERATAYLSKFFDE